MNRSPAWYVGYNNGWAGVYANPYFSTVDTIDTWYEYASGFREGMKDRQKFERVL